MHVAVTQFNTGTAMEKKRGGIGERGGVGHNSSRPPLANTNNLHQQGRTFQKKRIQSAARYINHTPL